MESEQLRQLPSVDRMLAEPRVRELLVRRSRSRVAGAVREALDDLRARIQTGELGPDGTLELSLETIAAHVVRIIERDERRLYRRAVNATGVIIHTGLGRAVFPERTRVELERALRGPVILEIDPETGERSEREAALRPLFEELTGAESATVVNNNAAATLLILAALAAGREVLISRGQLVEIGGSFRIPDILRASGARLVEVGTTNRTYREDYARALGPETALILDVHTSNFEIRGFTCRPALEELVRLGRERGIPVASDLGSGCFTEMSSYGFRPEPLVRDSVSAGADLVCFSGDKLLGGPQAGIIVGRAELVRRLRSHPLFRCLRVDKATLVLLAATLRIYLDPEAPRTAVPALRAAGAPLDEVERRAELFATRIRERARPSNLLEVEVVESSAEMGSGSLPAQEIPSRAVALRHRRLGSADLARALRTGDPPVFPRVQDDLVLLDFRSVLLEDETELARAIDALIARG